MEISTKGLYAIRGMVDLAIHSQRQPIPLSNVSVRQDISQHYLEQLFVKLRRAGIVRSVRGPGGGYLLARDPSEITVKDILNAVEETISPAECADEGTVSLGCNRIDSCMARLVMRELADNISRVLESITLRQLCDESGKMAREKVPTHNYSFSI